MSETSNNIDDKKSRFQFYKEQLPFLRLEDEFYRLKASIAENNLKSIIIEAKVHEALFNNQKQKDNEQGV